MSKTYLRVTTESQAAVYMATVARDYSDREHELMLDRHGPCKDVEVGGAFTENVPGVGPVSVTLPSAKRDFPDGFPHTQTFKASDFAGDYAAAVNAAKAWVIHVAGPAGQIQQALQALWDDVGALTFDDVETEELVTT